MHESMKPANLCQIAAKNANRTLGLINRSFHYRTKNTLIPLYKSLVRPKLEHAAAALSSPWLEKDRILGKSFKSAGADAIER